MRSPLHQIPSPPLPVSSPVPVSPPPLPASLTYPLGYRAAMIRLRAETPSTSHPLPPTSPIILPHTKASVAMIRAAAPSTYILASRSETPPSGTPPLLPGPRYEVGESLSSPTARPLGGFSVDYDIPGAPMTDDTELGRQMTEFDTRVKQDTDEIYVRDRRAHAPTALLMEREARMSRGAWGRSMDTSDLARLEVMSLRTTVLGQQAVITELRAADRRRQAAISELLAVDRRRQT
ncbi:hypothetical protein Tco_0590339 [Tanacetum coccineum]